MGTIIAFISIIVIASIFQTSTGFGFSIMATPFLLLLFLPQDAIQINIVLSLIISIALIWKIRSDVDKKLLKRMIFGSIAGVPFGIIIYMTVDIVIFKLMISIILLLLTLLLLSRVKMTPTSRRDYFVGWTSGILTTSIGMPGPPLLLYFTGAKITKEKLRATTLAFFLFIYSISLITQITFSGTTATVWMSSLYAIPLVIIGLVLGQYIFKKMNQQIFTVITYVLLLITGIYLLFDSMNSI
ncbi:sulfite exporter TauE/SafE family protein [Oceanobacillus sp. 1P07AA]|uniref:sulfite exporter TauE/SafE family protein n=1 Tax=Oceanobacillus sp. 1P07AA TaxID=3132293 RepID=UPI0039A61AEC